MSEIGEKYEGTMPLEIAVEGDIVLQILRPEDASEFFQILEDNPDIREFITWMQELDTEEKVRDKLRDFQAHRTLRYSIKEGDRLIGYMGIWRDPDTTDFVQYNIGYFLDKDLRGQGITGKALKRFLDIADSELNVDRFSAWVAVDNEKSANVLLRTGFKKDQQHDGKNGRMNWDYIREVTHE